MAKRTSTTKAKRVGNFEEWIERQPNSKKLRRLLEDLRSRLENDQRKELRWWRDVGQIVQEMLPQGQLGHGTFLMESLVNNLRPGRDFADKRLVQDLYMARGFAATMRPAEMKQMLTARSPQGKPLSIYQVKILVAIRDVGQRQKFLQKWKRHGWSVDGLRREVQRLLGRVGHRAGASLQPLGAMSPAVALRDISRLAGRWLQHHRSWFEGEKASLARMPSRAQNEAFANELNRAMEGMKEVQRAVQKGLKQLRTLARETRGTAGDHDKP